MDLYDDMSAYTVGSVTKTTNKDSMLDGKNLLFMTGFCVGMLFFYLVGDSFGKKAGNMLLDTFRQLQRMEEATKELLIYILECRVRQALLLIIVASGRLNKLVFYTVVGLAGFITGIMLLLFAYQFGFMGIIVAVGMIFPQGICYYKAFQIIFEEQYRTNNGDTNYYHNRNGITQSGWHKKKWILWKIVKCIALILLGVLAETYINTWLMHKILYFL